MKAISYILAVLGILLLIYAVIGRFVGGPTVFGYIYAMQPKTAISGANSILLLAVLSALYAKK